VGRGARGGGGALAVCVCVCVCVRARVLEAKAIFADQCFTRRDTHGDGCMPAQQVQARLSSKATPALSLHLAAHDRETKRAWMQHLQHLSLTLFNAGAKSGVQVQQQGLELTAVAPLALAQAQQARAAAPGEHDGKIDVLALQGKLDMLLDPPPGFGVNVEQQLTNKQRIKPKNILEVRRLTEHLALLKDIEAALLRCETEGSSAVNARESPGHATLLHRAAMANTPELVELLLEANALCDLA